MAAWPKANGSEVQERYTASHENHDGKSRQPLYSTPQPIKGQPGFDNLGLSLVSDGRTLSEVSSFHTASLSSNHSDQQLSVVQSYHDSHRRHSGGITIGGISIILTFLLFVITMILIAVVFKNQSKKVKIVLQILRAAGLCGFAGGLTNWLGIKLIFNRIPGIVFSGAVTKQFVPAKNLVANFILESFFSPLQVRQYLEEKKRDNLTPEHLDDLLEKCFNSVTVETVINHHLDALMGTPEGLRLRMLGVSKAKLLPLVSPYLSSLKVYIVPLLLSSVEVLEVLNAEQLRQQIVDLISTRTHGLSAAEFKRIVEDAVYKHLSWLVFWGSTLGAIVGCLAEVTSVYSSGILR